MVFYPLCYISLVNSSISTIKVQAVPTMMAEASSNMSILSLSGQLFVIGG